jgi:hypothetical protein
VSRSEREENREFEAEVRRVAEAVWGLAPGDCKPEHYSDNPVIRELDGIAKLRDVTHLLMVTVSRKLDKAKADFRKLEEASRIEGRDGVPTSKWFITKFALEAEHLKEGASQGVKALTLEQFRRRFFDGNRYVSARRNAAFGSARNLADGSITIGSDEYVPSPITEESRVTIKPTPSAGDGEATDVEKVSERLCEGDTLVLLGPFGAGKSLTTRELFLQLSKLYLKGTMDRVPLCISLRDHWGQSHADEILERHARSIGFTPREDLVTAWRAGFVLLLLDGFDELAAQVVARAENVNFMREARADSLAGVRDLISNTPSGTGLLVAGRDHYFDDMPELVRSLGLATKRLRVLRLWEFTEEQAVTFLKKRRAHESLPDWIPRKPLLLGYLAHTGLLEDILRIDGSSGFGSAWDQFLDMICAREAAHGRTVMDPETLRRVLERLACEVRATSSGNGPITGRELAEAYRLETGQPAGEGVLMQLQRLPGLAQREQDPGARSFIDEDLLAALQGSAVSRLVLEGTKGIADRSWMHALPRKALGMAAFKLSAQNAVAGTVLAATRRPASAREPLGQLAADYVEIALEMLREDDVLDCDGLALSEVTLGTINLEDARVDNLYIDNSIVDEVVLGARGINSRLSVKKCTVRLVSGVPSADGLPAGMFTGCEVLLFEDMSTNAAVMRTELAPTLKALLSVLRKLYLQAGVVARYVR